MDGGGLYLHIRRHSLYCLWANDWSPTTIWSPNLGIGAVCIVFMFTQLCNRLYNRLINYGTVCCLWAELGCSYCNDLWLGSGTESHSYQLDGSSCCSCVGLAMMWSQQQFGARMWNWCCLYCMLTQRWNSGYFNSYRWY